MARAHWTLSLARDLICASGLGVACGLSVDRSLASNAHVVTIHGFSNGSSKWQYPS